MPDQHVLLAGGAELRPVPATGASTSSSPQSTSISAARLVTVFVVDQTLVMVSRSHGWVRASSRYPPQMSTATSPSRSTTIDAPISSRASTLRASAARTGSNRSAQVPWISAMCSSPRCGPWAAFGSVFPARPGAQRSVTAARSAIAGPVMAEDPGVSGRCSGLHHSSVQPGSPHATLRWPPRADLAGAQSHGSQLMVTVPGRQG